MEKKYLLTVEFRWYISDSDDEYRPKSKECTVGVYDSFNEAVLMANKTIDDLVDIKFTRRFATRGISRSALEVSLNEEGKPWVFINISELEYIDIKQMCKKCMDDMKDM